MSSSVAPGLPVRPARWPWLVLAAFIAIVSVSLVLVSVNGESLGEQWPFVVAFTMFGVVGGLIVSRDRRNVIGALLLGASIVIAIGFISGESFTWAYRRGGRGLPVQFAAVESAVSWLFGIVPVVLLLPLLFPNGHLPSRRWRPLMGVALVVLVFLSVAGFFGPARVSGSTDAISIPNPLHVSALDQVSHASDGVIGLLIGSLDVRSSPGAGTVVIGRIPFAAKLSL